MRVIKGHPNYVVTRDGRVWSCHRHIYLKPYLRSRYWYVKIDGKNYAINRLVLSAFVREPENGEVGRHWDDNQGNNHLYNLVWGTHKQNAADAIRNGSNPELRAAKLSYEEVREIRKLHDEYSVSKRVLSSTFGIDRSGISRIVNRKSYAGA